MPSPSSLFPAGIARYLLTTPVLLGLGLLTLLLAQPTFEHSNALVNAAAPHGILSLQFACSGQAAGHILESWQGEAMAHAVLGLYWDFAYALAYGFGLALLTERILQRGGQGRPPWHRVLPWLPLLAAGLDVLENLFHLVLIQAAATQVLAWPAALACGCALGKWGLLALWLVLFAALWLRPRP